MNFLYIIYVLFLHFLPKKYLLHSVKKKLETDSLIFYPTFSGRVALNEIAKNIRVSADKQIALIPEYACNLIDKSLKLSGFEIETYKTDERFEPDIKDIKNKLSGNAVKLFVTACMFGSSAFLEHLSNDEIRKIIADNKIIVIVDICQDISLVKYIPSNYGDQLIATISFNNKSFPGVVGGGILSSGKFNIKTKPLSLKNTLSLYRKLHHNIIDNHFNSGYSKDSKKKENPTNFDHSYCEQFPYTFDNFDLSKLQLATALAGCTFLSSFHAKKMQFIRANEKLILKTKHFMTAPYLILNKRTSPHNLNRIKNSYSIPNDPTKSVRPDLIIVHNKGFNDK